MKIIRNSYLWLSCLVISTLVACSDNSSSTTKTTPTVTTNVTKQQIASYPVKFTYLLKIAPTASVATEFNSKKVGVLRFTTSGKEIVIATTCADYFNYGKQNYKLDKNQNETIEQFKNFCQPLLYLMQAKPAKVSYLRDFDLAKEYGSLPVTMIFPDMEGDSHAVPVEMAYSDTTLKNSMFDSKYSVTLTSSNSGREAVVSILAWGDFTDSGIDQMLIHVKTTTFDNTYQKSGTYIITRTSKNAPLSIIAGD